MKKYRDIWAVSLLIVGVITIILLVFDAAENLLPDTLIRILGVLDLAAVAALAYTSVKLQIWKKKE